MKLLELEINSFMAIGDEGVTFHFDDDIKTTIIVGDNGAGKSQIYEALNFLIYNKPYRKINKGNLVNAYTKKGAYVRGKFISNGKTFEVMRSIKPDNFTVKIDGEEQDAEIGSGYQKRFESLLGFDESFYRRTIVLGTSDYIEFMNLPAGGKRTFVENILELTTISKMDALNKSKIKNLNQEIVILDKDILNLGLRIQEMRNSDDQLYKLQQEAVKNATQRVIRAREELDTINDKVSSNESILASTEKPDGKEKELIPYPEYEQVVEREIDTSHIKEKIDHRNKEIDDLQIKINDIVTEKRILMSEGIAKKKEKDSLEGSEICPTCNQKMENHEAITKRKNDLIEEMKVLAQKVQSIDSTEEYENAQNRLRAEISELQKEERELYDQERKRVDHERSKIAQERNKIDIANNDIREYNANIKNQILEYNQKIAQHESLKNDAIEYETKLKDYETELEEIKQRKIVDNSENISNLEKERDIVMERKDDFMEEIMNRTSVGKLLGDSGIRSDMINRYIPEFNRFMMEYLEKMGADYIFTIDSEFNEKILSMGRENFKYGSFSRGEQARIDLAILFSWRRVSELVSGKKSSLLILDEVFDSATDESGVKSIKKIIDDMGEGVNVIIISHKPHNKNDFDRVIEVKKLGRFSKYEITDNV